MRILILQFVLALLFTSTLSAQPTLGDEHWDAQFGNLGASGSIRAIAIHGRILFVGGSFTQIAGVPAKNIAAYDGTNWAEVMGGTDGPVDALAIDSAGALIVGGEFTHTGTKAASQIASFSTNEWSPLGSGIPRSSFGVRTIAVTAGGTIYAGGGFDTNRQGEKLNNVAFWDGRVWNSLGGGITPWRGALPIWKLIAQNDSIYVGGYFTAVDGKAANGVAMWYNGSWKRFIDSTQFIPGGQINVSSIALTADSSLYICGSNPFGPDSIYSFARFKNGWQGLPQPDPAFRAGILESFGNTVYAAQDALAPIDPLYHNIAAYDSSGWHHLGSGIDGYVTTTVVDSSGDLFIAGTFNQAGNKPSQGLAEWHPQTFSGVHSSASSSQDLSITPDPVTIFGLIRFSLRSQSGVSISLLNDAGQTILSFPHETFVQGRNTIKLNLQSLPPGIYFLRLESAEGTQIAKLVKK